MLNSLMTSLIGHEKPHMNCICLIVKSFTANSKRCFSKILFKNSKKKGSVRGLHYETENSDVNKVCFAK